MVDGDGPNEYARLFLFVDLHDEPLTSSPHARQLESDFTVSSQRDSSSSLDTAFPALSLVWVVTNDRLQQTFNLAV